MPYKDIEKRRKCWRDYYANNIEKERKRTKETYIKTKEHKKEHARKTYNKTKKIMYELKINGCAICGYDKCNRALDFHHVNPEDKKFQVNMNSMDLKDKKIVEELNKCILLCKNCHYEIHDKRKVYE